MAILVKPIKNGEDVIGLGELAPGDVAEVTDGGVQFADGTVQTTAATNAVASVFGRTGAVVAAKNDYSAAQVSLDPANVEGIDATDVQKGFEQLSTLITSTGAGLVFMGQLAFDAEDPTPPTEAPSHYYIFNTDGDRPGVGLVQAGDWLVYNLQTSEWVHLAYENRTVVASQVGYDAERTANVYLTGPDVDAALDQTDAALVGLDGRIDAVESAPKVDSFKGRTGVVVPVAGDYTAAQTTFAPAGGITATDVQAAIVEVGAKAIPFFDTNGTARPIPLV